MMDPLSAYLLSVVKSQLFTTESPRFCRVQDALQEMGYWMLPRPIGVNRNSMPQTRINDECKFVEAFQLSDIMIDVYTDPDTADLTEMQS